MAKEEFWKMVNAFNREVVEPNANRYFFVKDPVEINIKGAQKEVNINLHRITLNAGKELFRQTAAYT